MFDSKQAMALGISGASDLAHETVEDQRHYHVHRLTLGWFTIIGGALACITCALLAAFASILFLIPTSASGAAFVKGTRMVGTARRFLRELDGKSDLPQAKVVS